MGDMQGLLYLGRPFRVLLSFSIASSKGVYSHVSVNDMYPLKLCRVALGEMDGLGLEVVRQRDGMSTLSPTFRPLFLATSN